MSELLNFVERVVICFRWAVMKMPFGLSCMIIFASFSTIYRLFSLLSSHWRRHCGRRLARSSDFVPHGSEASDSPTTTTTTVEELRDIARGENQAHHLVFQPLNWMRDQIYTIDGENWGSNNSTGRRLKIVYIRNLYRSYVMDRPPSVLPTLRRSIPS